MPATGLLVPGLLILTALALITRQRSIWLDALIRPAERIADLPSGVWLLLGALAFTMPLLEYWVTAHSHGNALAGYFPWGDAREYYLCTQAHLVGADTPAHCSKRPYYITFFTALLWLSGNDLQIALVIQALIAGLCATMFSRVVADRLGAAESLVAYAVLFAFAAALCTGLIMTENAGLFLGLLGLTLLWRETDDPGLAGWVLGLAALTLAVTARPGPMFILPALLAWTFSQFHLTARKRSVLIIYGITVVAAVVGYNYVLSLAGSGAPGQTHSNFSYNIYGLVAGGKGWLQVTRDHPELFISRSGSDLTNEVYRLAFNRFLEQPHLLLVGYLKGLWSYVDDLFRYFTEFKPLRFLMISLWAVGLWATLRRWKEPSASMLLWLQAGILFSSPFIIVDETNRVFAASMAVDALLCAAGLHYLALRLAPHTAVRQEHRASAGTRGAMTTGAIAVALLVPLGGVTALAKRDASIGIAAPACPENETGVVVAVGESALLLPLVGLRKEAIYPLRVRADLFAQRFHRRVRRKEELALPAGSSLLQGVRIDTSGFGDPVFLALSGGTPVAGQRAGFCVEARTGKRFFSTVSRMAVPADR